MKGLLLAIPALIFLQVKSCSGPGEPEPEKDASVDSPGDSSDDSSSDPSAEPPLHINYRDCGHDYDMVLPRAEAGDHLCVGKEDCYNTSGSPAGGCPNTCSCVCMYGVCYQHSCTGVGGCTEPPVYN